jgi:Protein of unknown function (DUF2800)
MPDDYHALASPSGAHRWLNCANSLAMEIGQPGGDSKAADLGTDKHELLAMCLEFKEDVEKYLGHILKKGHGVDTSFADDVQTVLDNVRDRITNYEAQGCTVTVEIEQDVPIDQITGEKGATGRVDIVLIVVWPAGFAWLDVIDAKFGFQEVGAEENPQLMMYGHGALFKFGLVEEFVKVNLVIEQPLRTGNEWSSTPGEIETWAYETVQPKAGYALWIRDNAERGVEPLNAQNFAPAEKTCMWCKAKAVCPALLAKVEETVGASFEELDELPMLADPQHTTVERLGEIFPNLELVEDWIKAVRARVEFEMFAGRKVPGVKVVAGKRGNRAWADDAEAEAMLKAMRVKQDEMYSFKLLGPKPILELLKTKPRNLKRVEQLVIQPEGKPHVVLDSDKRPAIEIKPVDDGFDAEDELC